jgi:hypothetical protein
MPVEMTSGVEVNICIRYWPKIKIRVTSTTETLRPIFKPSRVPFTQRSSLPAPMFWPV